MSVSTIRTGMPAALACSRTGSTSEAPAGATARAETPLVTWFSRIDTCWSMFTSRSGARTVSFTPGAARAASSAPDFTRCHHSLSSALVTNAISILLAPPRPQETPATAITATVAASIVFLCMVPRVSVFRRHGHLADIDRPLLLIRRVGRQADFHRRHGVRTGDRWPLRPPHLVHEILDLREVGALEPLEEIGHGIVRNPFVGHHQNGRLAEIADLDGALRTPNLATDVIAENRIAAQLHHAQTPALKNHVNDGVVYVADFLHLGVSQGAADGMHGLDIAHVHAGRIEIVNAHICDQAARDLRVAEFERRGKRVPGDGSENHRRPDRPRFHLAPRAGVSGIEASLETHLQERASLLYYAEYLDGVVERQRHRLFAKHRLAGSGGVDDYFLVRACGGDHCNCVDIAVFEQVVVALIGSVDAEFPGERCGQPGLVVRNRHQARIGHALGQVSRVHATHAPD